jgi:hypothetical protein
MIDYVTGAFLFNNFNILLSYYTAFCCLIIYMHHIEMKRNLIILRWSILAGSIYFLGIAIVHLLDSKIPGLFIYFALPSNLYQDRITSFLAFGWSVFFFTAFKNPIQNIHLIKAILIAGAFAISILCIINLSSDINILSDSKNIKIIWLETSLLFFYWVWLIVFYILTKKELT